ncbi:hypothetical protein QZH41_001643 [Actinostola sp. cb2023]|nr:hypothetical protein QZH41_001643 [Actinostola sp. cb2023]
MQFVEFVIAVGSTICAIPAFCLKIFGTGKKLGSIILFTFFFVMLLSTIDNLELDEDVKIMKQHKMDEETSVTHEKLPLRIRIYERFKEDPRLVKMSRLKIASEFPTPKIRESFMRRFVNTETLTDLPLGLSEGDEGGGATTRVAGRRAALHDLPVQLLNSSISEASRSTKIFRKQSTVSALINDSNHRRTLAQLSPVDITGQKNTGFRSASRRFRTGGRAGRAAVTEADVKRAIVMASQGNKKLHSQLSQEDGSRKDWDVQSPLFALPRDSWFRAFLQSIIQVRYVIPPGYRDRAKQNRMISMETIQKTLASQTYLEWTMVFITLVSFSMSIELGIRILADGLLFTPNAIIQNFGGVLDIFAIYGVQVFAGNLKRCNDVKISVQENCTGYFMRKLATPRELSDLEGYVPSWLEVRDVIQENVVIVLMECLTLAVTQWTTENEKEDTMVRDGVTTLAAACTFFFVIDAILKIISYTFEGYWRSSEMYQGALVFGVVIIVFRFLTLSGKHNTLKMLMLTVVMSLVKCFFTIAVLVVLMMCYSLAGVILFGSVKYGEAVNRHANFHTSFTAMILLFRIITGEDWNKVMHDCMIDAPYCTPADDEDWRTDCGNRAASLIFFISFYVLVTFVLLNVFVAVIIENFSLFYASDEDSYLSNTDLRDFQMAWNLVDKGRRGVMSVPQAKLFLRVYIFFKQNNYLKGRLGVDDRSTSFRHMCCEIDKLRNGGDVSFHDVLGIIAYRTVNITHCLQLEELLEREELEYTIDQEVAIQTIRDWFIKLRMKRDREKQQKASASPLVSSTESLNNAGLNDDADRDREHRDREHRDREQRERLSSGEEEDKEPEKIPASRTLSSQSAGFLAPPSSPPRQEVLGSRSRHLAAYTSSIFVGQRYLPSRIRRCLWYLS